MTENSENSPVTSANAPTPALWWRRPWAWKLFCLLILVLLLSWLGRNTWELRRTQREFSQRIAESSQRGDDTEKKLQETNAVLTDAQKKMVVLEVRLAESQAQQAALEQLYTELSRHKDEALAAEVEQLVSLAAQQLQLTGNVSGALILLQNADNRLARVDRPQFIGVRRALARDIERLKILPGTDLSGLVVKLDHLIQSVDTLPLLADAQSPPRIPLQSVPQATGAAARTQPAWSGWWSGVWHGVTQQFQSLFQVRKLNDPEVMLLSPSQSYFLRENLKLRLLNARLQLMARNESGFHQDILSSKRLLVQYFDPQQKNVQTTLQLLDQLRQAEVTVALPNLSESLNAVRYFKPDMTPARSAAKER
ncbi:MAG: uroporphyrinogen-III C-methyltransferase [bacterium]|jgi:uroporphyrin-3 C-methyltransferase